MLVGKPRITVGTMGHADHGKTTLTAAIIKALRDRHIELTFVEPCNEVPEGHLLVPFPRRVEYEASRRYELVDPLGGFVDATESMIPSPSLTWKPTSRQVSGTRMMDALLVASETRPCLPGLAACGD